MLLLLGGLLASGLLVDTGAESAFEPAKRLAAIVAVGLAAAFWVARGDVAGAREFWLRASRGVRASIAAFGAGMAGLLISALLSPRSEASLATVRGTLVIALAAPLVALLFDRRAMRRALGCFVVVATINAVASILQRTGGWKPWLIERVSGRTEAVGFFGNEGVLALAAAAGAVAAAGLWIDSRGGARAFLAAAVAANVAGVAANASLTPILALGAGGLALAVARASRRRLAAGVAIVAVAGAIAILAVPQLRHRALEVRRVASAGDFDALTSYRFGAWAAAAEMIAARPLAGFGPGTYASEFVEHRIAAETRWKRSLANPVLAGGSYEDAHSDYLQLAAEAGLVVALLFGASAALALLGLVRAWRASEPESSAEAVALLAVAAVIAVAALAWFPMQRPATALLAMMLLGRAWSLAPSAEGDAA